MKQVIGMGTPFTFDGRESGGGNLGKIWWVTK